MSPFFLYLYPPCAFKKKKKVDKTFPDWKKGIGWSGKRSWSWPKEEGERGMCGLLISVLVITNITCLPPSDAWSLLEPGCAGSTAGSWGLGWPLVWLGSAGCRGDASVGGYGGFKSPCRHLPGGNGASSPCVASPKLCKSSCFMDALGQGRIPVVPSTSPCTRAGCAPRTSGAPHGLILQCQRFTRSLQKGLRPPSSTNKPLQVMLLGKPDSFINIHNVNCCNLKAGFPLLGMWVCAAGVETCRGMFPC